MKDFTLSNARLFYSSVADAMLYQLSYEATQFRAGQLIELICFRSIVLGQFVGLSHFIQDILIVKEVKHLEFLGFLICNNNTGLWTYTKKYPL